MLWVVEPDVAVIVTCDVVAAGVVGAVGVVGAEGDVGADDAVIPLEQPTTIPEEISRTARIPSSLMGITLPVELRRAKARSEPKGSRRAAAIPAN